MARALIFPGQGSQVVGMGELLHREFTVARETFAEAEATLGAPIARLCFKGPEEELRLTENAQPALLTASIAAMRVAERECGLQYSWVAGHSLGEYSALVAAGVIGFPTALKAVRLRGQLMQRAVPPGEGAMTAVVGLGGEQVASLCQEAAQGQVVNPANFNGAGQVVVAGDKEAVDRFKELARAKGAKGVIDLSVSAPFHCALMAPAARGMEQALLSATFSSPRVPVITNVEALPCSDPERLRQLLVAQITAPVKWGDSMNELARLGCKQLVEFGPGRVLTKLAARMRVGFDTLAVSDASGISALKQKVQRVL